MAGSIADRLNGFNKTAEERPIFRRRVSTEKLEKVIEVPKRNFSIIKKPVLEPEPLRIAIKSEPAPGTRRKDSLASPAIFSVPLPPSSSLFRELRDTKTIALSTQSEEFIPGSLNKNKTEMFNKPESSKIRTVITVTTVESNTNPKLFTTQTPVVNSVPEPNPQSANNTQRLFMHLNYGSAYEESNTDSPKSAGKIVQNAYTPVKLAHIVTPTLSQIPSFSLNPVIPKVTTASAPIFFKNPSTPLKLESPVVKQMDPVSNTLKFSHRYLNYY